MRLIVLRGACHRACSPRPREHDRHEHQARRKRQRAAKWQRALPLLRVGHQPGRERLTPLHQRGTEVAIEGKPTDRLHRRRVVRADHPRTLQHDRWQHRDDGALQPLAHTAALQQRPQRRRTDEGDARIACHHTDRGRDPRAPWPRRCGDHRRQHQRRAGEKEWLAQHRDMYLVHRRHREQRQCERHADHRRGRRAHEHHEHGHRHERGDRLHEPSALGWPHPQAHRDRERRDIAGREMHHRRYAVPGEPECGRHAIARVRRDGFGGAHVLQRIRVEPGAEGFGDLEHEREGDDPHQRGGQPAAQRLLSHHLAFSVLAAPAIRAALALSVFLR